MDGSGSRLASSEDVRTPRLAPGVRSNSRAAYAAAMMKQARDRDDESGTLMSGQQ